MADKPEAKEAVAPVPAKAAPSAKTSPGGDKASPAEKPSAAASAAPSSGKLGLIAAIAAVVLAPALSLGIAQFVMLPRLQKNLGISPATAVAEEGRAAEGGSADGKGGKPAPPTYEFSNVVVNLAGTMGTRYLKTSFIVTGSDAGLHAMFDANKARLTDVTLNVLSALTLADLEEPGSKNVLREKLVTEYNQVLGRTVVDQVYFSDFVVQ